MKTEQIFKNYLGSAGKLACILICLYFFLNILFFDTYSFIVFFTSNNRLKKLTVSNERIISQNNQLEMEIEKLKNDQLYIESIARKHFTMVREGETVYVFRRN